MSQNINFNWRFASLLFILSVAVYMPGLPGGFIYDDHFNFIQNSKIYNSDLSFPAAWSATMSGISGPLGRPISMFSFYVNYHLTGFSPLGFKVFNIIIHGLNTVLVYLVLSCLLKVINNREYLSNKVFKNENIAFWVAILWAVHPVNLTAVLYVVQRMTSMSATFTLLGIYFYIELRDSLNLCSKAIFVRLVLIAFLGIISALCKENGLLLFLYLLVVECFLFRWRTSSLLELRYLKLFYLFVLVIPIFILFFLLANGYLTANYINRDFDLIQRLLSEFRVLWFYIFQIILPQAGLFGLHHDDFIVSRSLFEPVTTFWSIISFALIGILIFGYFKKLFWLGFGVTFFFAGHVMESTILPLNLVHEHRNYLPSLGLILIFVISLIILISRVSNLKNYIFFITITILFSFITVNRAYDWSDIILLGERLAQRHPNSVTSNYEMGYSYVKLYEKTKEEVFALKAMGAFKKAIEISNYDMQSAIAYAHVNAMLGREEDSSVTNKIAMDFKHHTVSKREVIALRHFVDCQIKKVCKTSDVMMQSIFTNMLKNSRLKGRLRDDVLYIYSSYYEIVFNDMEQALIILKGVVSRNSHVLEYQVKLIQMLLKNGNNTEAKVLMDKVSEQFRVKWDVIKK